MTSATTPCEDGVVADSFPEPPPTRPTRARLMIVLRARHIAISAMSTSLFSVGLLAQPPQQAAPPAGQQPTPPGAQQGAQQPQQPPRRPRPYAQVITNRA